MARKRLTMNISGYLYDGLRYNALVHNRSMASELEVMMLSYLLNGNMNNDMRAIIESASKASEQMISLRLSEGLNHKLRVIAARESRTLSAQIRHLLHTVLESEEYSNIENDIFE